MNGLRGCGSLRGRGGAFLGCVLYVQYLQGDVCGRHDLFIMSHGHTLVLQIMELCMLQYQHQDAMPNEKSIQRSC